MTTWADPRQRSQVRRLDIASGSLTPLVSVGAGDQSLLMNDGKCDPRGRLPAGTMHLAALPGRGALFRYDPPDGAESMIEGVGISNGLAWDSLGTTPYYIDLLLGRSSGCAMTVNPDGSSIVALRSTWRVIPACRTGWPSTPRTACGLPSGEVELFAGSTLPVTFSRRYGFLSPVRRAVAWAATT